MSCNGKDFFQLANALLEGAEDECEALRRSIVSRAYYGALHSVDAVFQEDGRQQNDNNGSSHERIICKAEMASKRPGNGKRSAAIIAKLMPRIKKLRVSADYRLSEDFHIGYVDEALKRSKEIIEHCDEYARKSAQS